MMSSVNDLKDARLFGHLEDQGISEMNVKINKEENSIDITVVLDGKPGALDGTGSQQCKKKCGTGKAPPSRDDTTDVDDTKNRCGKGGKGADKGETLLDKFMRFLEKAVAKFRKELSPEEQKELDKMLDEDGGTSKPAAKKPEDTSPVSDYPAAPESEEQSPDVSESNAEEATGEGTADTESVDEPGTTPEVESTEATQSETPDPASAGGKTYIIQPGDTMSAIVKSTGVTLGALMKANPDKIKNPDQIKAGDELVVPDGSKKDPVPAGFDTKSQAKALTDEETKARADKWVKQLVKDLGLTRAQAVGIVANLCHESWGLNPGIMQGGQIGDPSEQIEQGVNMTGFGICQWGEDRRQGLINYAKLQGLPVTSEAAQYGFIREELETQFQPHLNLVKGIKGEGAEASREVAALFAGGNTALPLANGVRGYLAPSNPMVEDRKKWVGDDGEIVVPSGRPTAKDAPTNSLVNK